MREKKVNQLSELFSRVHCTVVKQLFVLMYVFCYFEISWNYVQWYLFLWKLFLAPEKVENIAVTDLSYARNHITVNISWELPCLVNGPHSDTLVSLAGIPTEGNEPTHHSQNIGKSLYLVTNVTYSTRYTVMIWLILENKEMGREAVHNFTTPSGCKYAIFF